METRIEEEVALLKEAFPGAVADGLWVRVPNYSLPAGWSRSTVDVAFLVPQGYPGTPPYGLYVPSDLQFNGSPPDNFQPSAPQQPPFPGPWGILSWQPQQEHWRPGASPNGGHNLVSWALGFRRRFAEGK